MDIDYTGEMSFSEWFDRGKTKNFLKSATVILIYTFMILLLGTNANLNDIIMYLLLTIILATIMTLFVYYILYQVIRVIFSFFYAVISKIVGRKYPMKLHDFSDKVFNYVLVFGMCGVIIIPIIRTLIGF